MEKFCLDLYKHMMEEIEQCGSIHQSTREWIECSFVAAEKYWMKLRLFVMSRGFESRCEEIRFFKVLKPQFTGNIEFFLLLYKAEIFAPEDQDSAITYWQREIKLAEEYIAGHEKFYWYIKSSRTDKDIEYFTTANADNGKPFRLSNGERTPFSSHDHLVAGIISRERLVDYVEKKLDKIPGISGDAPTSATPVP